MKRFLSLLTVMVVTAVISRAQNYVVTPGATTYSTAGGNVTFTVTLAYPAGVGAVSFSAKPASAAWKFVSAGGTNVPELSPQANDTTDPADAGSAFGFTYFNTIPATSASFTFTVNLPAGLSGSQTINFKGDYRLNGVLSTATVAPAAITLTPQAAIPTIITQPSSTSVTVGQNGTFTVVASGEPAPTYQWQRSTDAGVTWSNLSNDSTYSGTTTATLTVTGVTLLMTNHRFRVVVSNTQGTATSNGAAALTATQAPSITQQPVDQSALAGTAVTFTVAATGSGTLAYKWYFTPSGGSAGVISGATNASYTVSNAQAANAGLYYATVTNGVNPDATSTSAQLTIVERIVRVVSQTTAPSTSIVVPIQLVAKGDEFAVSFTIEFSTTKLTYTDSSIVGTDSSTGTIVRNVTQATSGKLSFAISKPSGEVYAAGTRTLVNLTFTVGASAVDGDVLALTFTDSLALRKITNGSSATLPGPFTSGSITVSTGLEGDVNGDGAVDLSDWVKLGRIVVGLDPMPAAGVGFMKSDCAPRATKGDGTIDLSDWVQAGRFVVGLDTPQPAGGPSAPTP
jgi:hypothetical protein